MEKKYKLTDETIKLNGVTLYRIEALKDFSNIIKGHGGILDRLDSIFAVGIYVASVLVLIGNSWSFLK